VSTTTKYLDVRAKLQQTISNLPPHTAIAQERELSEQFGVSRMTLRRAIGELTRQGLLYAVRGQGTFVAEPRISKGAELTSFSEDMRARGFEPGSRIISASVISAPPTIARDLELPAEAEVVELSRIRLADGLPICLEKSYLPARFFPDLIEHDLSDSLHDTLRTRYRTRIAQADQLITAVSLTKVQADLLGSRRGSPALQVRRITADQRGRLIEHATSVYRGDRYDFRSTVAPSSR
jgi:GntR family transcriptional regulator